MKRWICRLTDLKMSFRRWTLCPYHSIPPKNPGAMYVVPVPLGSAKNPGAMCLFLWRLSGPSLISRLTQPNQKNRYLLGKLNRLPVVLWRAFGVCHVSRVEDFLVMLWKITTTSVNDRLKGKE
jgi:hypothetical protein